MITKQKALYLLEEAFDRGEPTMVHGTSVESVIELLKTGKLPSSFFPNHSDHPVYQGFLYFVPRKRSFTEHPLYDSITIDLDSGKLEGEVKSYAGEIQRKRFLINNFGNWPPATGTDEFKPYGSFSLDHLKERGVNTEAMKEYGLHKLYLDLKKIQGVCIALNDKIFELEIHMGTDVPGEEVMIHLPNGLDIKYIHYIYPLRQAEDRALRRYIEDLA